MITKLYSILFLFVIILRIHHLKAVSIAREEKTQFVQGPVAEAENDRDLQCGGVHEVFDEPSILSYRYNQPIVSPQESCIWTLYAANRSLIKINVTDYTIIYKEPYQFLAVGFFNKSNYDLINYFTWIKLPDQTSLVIEVPGPVAFVHFSYVVPLHYVPNFGFRLTFEAGGEEQSSIFNFENYFLGGQYGRFKYPQNGGSYKNNQRVTIVVKPNSGFPVEGHPSPSRILIKNIGIEDSQGCLADNINFYSFGEGSQTWYRTGSRCGKTSDPSYYEYSFYHPRNDPMILTFKSDDSGVGSGFELLWLNDDF